MHLPTVASGVVLALIASPMMGAGNDGKPETGPVEIREAKPGGWQVFMSPPKYQCYLFEHGLWRELKKGVEAVRSTPGFKGFTGRNTPRTEQAVDVLSPETPNYGITYEVEHGKLSSPRTSLRSKRAGSVTIWSGPWETLARIMEFPSKTEDDASNTYTFHYNVRYFLAGKVDPATLTRGPHKPTEKTYLCTFAIPTGKAFIEAYKEYVRSAVRKPDYDLVADDERRLISYGEYGAPRESGSSGSSWRCSGHYRRDIRKRIGEIRQRSPGTPMLVLQQQMELAQQRYALDQIPATLEKWRQALGQAIYLGHVEAHLIRCEYPAGATSAKSGVMEVYELVKEKRRMEARDGMRFYPRTRSVDGRKHMPLHSRIYWFRGKHDGTKAWHSQAYITYLFDLWKIDENDNLERMFTVTSSDLQTVSVTKEDLVKLCRQKGVKVETE